MKRIYLTLVLIAAMLVPAISMSAKTSDEEKLVDAMNAQLPVYMGKGMSWTGFDIAENGDYVIVYTSTELPEASKVDDNAKAAFADSIHNSLGANKGLIAACKSTGRNLLIKVYNPQKELCLEERFTLDTLK